VCSGKQALRFRWRSSGKRLRHLPEGLEEAPIPSGMGAGARDGCCRTRGVAYSGVYVERAADVAEMVNFGRWGARARGSGLEIADVA
jgi:hypothetical protein